MAPFSADPRRFPRINLEEGCSIQFKAGGRSYFGLPVTTLGGGGCCFRVSTQIAGSLRTDDLLVRVLLDHPGLPQIPQRAKVCWVQDAPRAHEAPFVRIGIEFVDPDPAFSEALGHSVQELLRLQRPGQQEPPHP